MNDMFEFIARMFSLPIHLWRYFTAGSVTLTPVDLDLLIHKSIQMGVTLVSAHVAEQQLLYLDKVETVEELRFAAVYADEVDKWIDEIKITIKNVNN